MTILYIGDKIEKPQSGGDQINYRNQVLLRNIQGRDLDYISIRRDTKHEKLTFGITRNIIYQIIDILRSGTYSHVFVSQSLFGRIVKRIKQIIPNVKVITFFHNIESAYGREYLKVRGLKALPFYLTASYFERMSCQYSDYIITLNSRDTKVLLSEYGKVADIELPTSLEDKFCKELIGSQQILNPNDIVYLFVGVAFFANVEGIKWFVTNVLPSIPGRLIIAGKGMDNEDFPKSDRLTVFGFVDDLSSLYYNATMVVSPILSGAGMKTKTAEALMYGKTVLGTKEAFEGYDINDSFAIECNTANEFISAINNLAKSGELHAFNPNARLQFEANHSLEISLRKMSILFEL